MYICMNSCYDWPSSNNGTCLYSSNSEKSHNEIVRLKNRVVNINFLSISLAIVGLHICFMRHTCQYS